MRRRKVLSALALVPLSGCLDSAGGSGGTETTTTTDQTTETPTTDQSTTTTTDSTSTPSEADWATSFQLQNIECASEDAQGASVSFADPVVEVTGTAIGADQCWVAQLDRVTYDEMTKELVLVVESLRQADEDTMCAQCISAIEYGVTVTFSSGYPDAVEVVHAREGSETTITRATR